MSSLDILQGFHIGWEIDPMFDYFTCVGKRGRTATIPHQLGVESETLGFGLISGPKSEEIS